MIVGDFNAHHPLWGSNKTDKRGKDLEEIILDLNLAILNDGAPTFVDYKSTDLQEFLQVNLHVILQEKLQIPAKTCRLFCSITCRFLSCSITCRNQSAV